MICTALVQPFTYALYAFIPLFLNIESSNLHSIDVPGPLNIGLRLIQLLYHYNHASKLFC